MTYEGRAREKRHRERLGDEDEPARSARETSRHERARDDASDEPVAPVGAITLTDVVRAERLRRALRARPGQITRAEHELVSLVSWQELDAPPREGAVLTRPLRVPELGIEHEPARAPEPEPAPAPSPPDPLADRARREAERAPLLRELERWIDGARRVAPVFAAEVMRAEAPRNENDPPRTIDPDTAYLGLAVHTAVDAVRVSLATPGARLAARQRGEAAELAEPPRSLLGAIEAASSDAGEPLPADVRARLEEELGHDFGHVRVHTGAAAAAAARALNARAFTCGSHIYFDDGELAPDSDAGARLLRHELTHVIQHDRGRLAARGHGLEVEAYDGAAETEARAAESAPAAPAARASRPTHATTAPIGPGAHVSLGIRDTIASGLNTVGGAISDGVGGVVSMGADAFMTAVRHVSPRLADLIQRGPAALVGDGVRDAVTSLIGTLVPDNPLGGIAAFGAGIVDIASVLVGAAQGDNKCCETFATWCEKLGQLARKGARSELVKGFKAVFDTIDHWAGIVVRVFGGALTEALRGQMQFLTEMGSWIATAIHDVGEYLRPAADWVLRQLGLPSVASIGTWLEGFAERAWEAIKSGLSAAVQALRELGPALLRIAGLEPFIDAFRFGLQLIEVTDWLIAHRNDPEIVKHAREQMAHTFLPQLLERMGTLVGKIQAAVHWMETHVAETITILVAASLIMTGVLAPVGIALLGLLAALRALWPIIQPKLAALLEDLQALWRKFYEYARPVIETLTQLAILATNPWLAPIIIASTAWLLLPECFKAPILDLMLDLIIALLEASPNAVVFFGPLWRYMKAGAIGFLTQIRTTWSGDEKVRAINKVARMGSGRSPEMIAGFVVGFFKGVVYGVIDPFKMIYELLKIGWEITAWLARLINHAPEVAPIIQRHLPELQAKAEQIAAAGQAAIERFLAGEIGFEDLWKLITSFADSLEAKAGDLGKTAADKLRGWILGADTEYSIGETIGIVIGFIIVFALIVYFSGGVAAEAEGALAVIRTIAKILNAPYELLGAALRPLATAFRPVLNFLAMIGERIGLKAVWEGAMRAFEGFVNTLGRMVEEIVLAIEGRLAARAAEQLLARLTERVGAEVAEKLVNELGAAAAERLVDRLGESVVRRLGELSPEVLARLAARFEGPFVERMLDAGMSAASVGRLGSALEREAIERLLESGLTGAQLDRLATLSAEKLQALSTAQLQRMAALPEEGFHKLASLSDDGLRRMLGLTDAQLPRFLALTEEQLRVFAALDEAALRRFATMPEAQFGRFSAMSAADLQKFAGLSENAFARFAAADAATLDKFRAMTPEQLERFGGLTEAAFNRYAALDAATIQKFQNLPASALETFGTIADDAFRAYAALDAAVIEKFQAVAGPRLERMAQARFFPELQTASRATIEKFGQLSDATFDRFGGMRGLTEDVLNKLGALDTAVLDNIAGVADPALFNILVRRIEGDALGRLGQLAPAEIEQIFAAGREAALRAFGELEPAAIREFLALPPAQLERFGRVPGADLRGFSGLTTAELQKFARVPEDQLARLGQLGDPAALRHFSALSERELMTLSELGEAELRVWAQVQPQTLAKFAPMEGTLADWAALGAPALDRLAALNAPYLKQLALVDRAGLQRLANLPPGDLAKLEGLPGFDLQRAAQLPPGELERMASTMTQADLQAALRGDAAAAHAQAAGLDAGGGHGFGGHGAHTQGAAQENRLRTGTRPDGAHAPTDVAGAWASDAVQVRAAQMGEGQLTADLGGGVVSTRPDYGFEYTIDLHGAGYSYTIDPATNLLVERQANRFTIVFRPRVPPPPPATAPGDFFILTSFPVL